MGNSLGSPKGMEKKKQSPICNLQYQWWDKAENKHFLSELISSGDEVPNLDKPSNYVEGITYLITGPALFPKGRMHHSSIYPSWTLTSDNNEEKWHHLASWTGATTREQRIGERNIRWLSTNESLYEEILIVFKSRNNVFREQYFDY